MREVWYQADFAGGVMGSYFFSEADRSAVCPELIVSSLFSEDLMDNECLVVTGFERFSSYTDFVWKIEVMT